MKLKVDVYKKDSDNSGVYFVQSVLWEKSTPIVDLLGQEKKKGDYVAFVTSMPVKDNKINVKGFTKIESYVKGEKGEQEAINRVNMLVMDLIAEGKNLETEAK